MGGKLILPDSIKGEDFLKIMRKMPHGRNRIRDRSKLGIKVGRDERI